MKNILVISLGFLILNTTAQINVKPVIDSASKHIAKASGVVHEDLKSIVSYGIGKTEQATDTLYKLLNKGYAQLSKGAGHTFEVLKTQQLVKSLHHLFYWILSLVLIVVVTKGFKKYYLNDKKEDWEIIRLLILTGSLIVLFIYNASNFMEMWTGFINPEYGVYMEILEYLNK